MSFSNNDNDCHKIKNTLWFLVEMAYKLVLCCWLWIECETKYEQTNKQIRKKFIDYQQKETILFEFKKEKNPKSINQSINSVKLFEYDNCHQ